MFIYRSLRLTLTPLSFVVRLGDNNPSLYCCTFSLFWSFYSCCSSSNTQTRQNNRGTSWIPELWITAIDPALRAGQGGLPLGDRPAECEKVVLSSREDLRHSAACCRFFPSRRGDTVWASRSAENCGPVPNQSAVASDWPEGWWIDDGGAQKEQVSLCCTGLQCIMCVYAVVAGIVCCAMHA